MEILHSGSNSITDKKREVYLDINIKQTIDELKHINFQKNIDLVELHNKEKRECKKYRLILTVNPFMSNVLFNPLTEIIYKEGSDEAEAIVDNKKYTIKDKSNLVIGREVDVTRQYMIENTEYSSDVLGYTYNIGYDFTNNHILRNTTFKSVTKAITSRDKNTFNTISDTMRDDKGKVFMYRNRFSHLGITDSKQKMLYNSEDLLKFSEKSLDLLVDVENGWYGIKNRQKVKPINTTDGQVFHKPINNKEHCSFVDFYPDRTLFSFTPKYNKYKRRAEHNWDCVITYPYRNLKDNNIITSNGVNSIRIASFTIARNANGILEGFLTPEFNLNLTNNDVFALYFVDGTNTIELANNMNIQRIIDKTNTFVIRDLSPIYDMFPVNNFSNLLDVEIENINAHLGILGFRMAVHASYGKMKEYYIKTVKRLPNLKFKKREYDFLEDFNLYTMKNATDANGKIHDFNKDVYKLGFSNTLFSDQITQFTFTDDIDVEYIRDEQGRELNQFYITFIKSNRGNVEWYENNDYTNENVEFSHCFGDVCSAFQSNTPEYMIKTIDGNMDVRLANNTRFAGVPLFGFRSLEENITSDGGIHPNEFMLGLYDYNPETLEENLISKVYHRFNTYQRELGEKRNVNKQYTKSVFSDIERDAEDWKGFFVKETDLGETTYQVDGKVLSFLDRPEGYYYQPHYEVKIKERTKNLKRVNNRVLHIVSLSLTNNQEILIKSKTAQALTNNDFIEIINDSGKRSIVRIIETFSKVDFRCRLEFGDLLDYVSTDSYFTIYGKTIPSYAKKIDNNTYVWEEFLPFDNENIQYKNLRNYVNLNINFFLKRQDPEGVSGLHQDIEYGDIPGKVSDIEVFTTPNPEVENLEC